MNERKAPVSKQESGTSHGTTGRYFLSLTVVWLILNCAEAGAVEFLGQTMPAWAMVPPAGAEPLTESSAVGMWQEDLQPGMRESNGRPSFPGMTWVLRADHTASIFGSCRNGKPSSRIDGRWQLDEHHFLKVDAMRKDGKLVPIGTMPAWTIDGKLALPPNHPGGRSALERYEGSLPPRCPA